MKIKLYEQGNLVNEYPIKPGALIVQCGVAVPDTESPIEDLNLIQDTLLDIFDHVVILSKNVTYTIEAQQETKTKEEGVIVGGVYRHFKGGEYVVVGFAKHTETMETMVLYRKYHSVGDTTHARPIERFVENVVREDYCGPRFVKSNLENM